jgi:2-C-methyl-D-erythritol 4-phosphate cytidylyltransferase
MKTVPAVWVVVPAAGSGSRMKASVPKQYLSLEGKAVLSHTLQVLLACDLVCGVVVVISANDSLWQTLPEYHDNRVHTVQGKGLRAESVLSGLSYLSTMLDSNAFVLVHDGARPCLRERELRELIVSLSSKSAEGALLAVPVQDTLKHSDDTNHVLKTVSRNALWQAQTPQGFKLKALINAIELALNKGCGITDEASAMEMSGVKPLLIEGRSDNIKITRPADLRLAAFFLSMGDDS